MHFLLLLSEFLPLLLQDFFKNLYVDDYDFSKKIFGSPKEKMKVVLYSVHPRTVNLDLIHT